MRTFQLYKDPQALGYPLFKKSRITIQEGLTVLVGCNGIGKTTLIRAIIDSNWKKNIPTLSFDNLHDGGFNARAKAGYDGDMSFLATSMFSSEGENIYLNVGKFVQNIGQFIRKHDNVDEIWICMDAVDSGFSIDNVVELKELIKDIILGDNKEKSLYIIVSANEYETANGEECFDVYNGKYIKFKDYEDYKKMILESRKQKDNRDKS